MTIQLSPKQADAMDILASEKYQFIMYGGSMAGGKTFWGLCALLIMCKIFPGSRWCVIREDMEKIRITTIPSFRKLNAPGRLRENPYEYTHPNGSVIMFKGENYDNDKDLQWLKGLEVNGFLFEEINECQQDTFELSFSRAGRWECEPRPKPIVLATCNPTQNWVKKLIYDRWQNGELPKSWYYLPAYVTDNPYLTDEYKANLLNLPRYKYEVYVKGNWSVQLQNGNEFYDKFDTQKHLTSKHYDPALPVHISMDSNVYPYIAITIWQLIPAHPGFIIRQIAELPCSQPDNKAPAAADKVCQWLKLHNYKEGVHLYGDYSTKNANTIDPHGRSFFQIINERVMERGYRTYDHMRPHASPASIGEFINEIYIGAIPGLSIEINETCLESINDYIATKKDVNGNILKEKVQKTDLTPAHEKNGHICDNKKDLIVQAFKPEYEKFLTRNSIISPGGISAFTRRKTTTGRITL